LRNGIAPRLSRSRFLLEATQPFAIRADGLGQHFDRDLTIQPGVVRAVDFAHSACTQG
jgi:hypothetical protein